MSPLGLIVWHGETIFLFLCLTRDEGENSPVEVLVGCFFFFLALPSNLQSSNVSMVIPKAAYGISKRMNLGESLPPERDSLGVTEKNIWDIPNRHRNETHIARTVAECLENIFHCRRHGRIVKNSIMKTTISRA